MVAIGFDLGETLLTYADIPPSWVSLYSAALTRVAECLCIAPSPAQLEESARILARYNTRLHPRREEIAAAQIFAAVLAGWSLAPNSLTPAIAAFFEFFQQRLVAYPESASVLANLRASGRRIGVLTDVPYGMPRPFVERDLAEAGLLAGVDQLLTSVDVGRRKPDAAGFHALAAKLGVAIDQLWFIGNEEKDIAGALAAGATALLIDRENRRPQWGQAHTLKDLRDLLVLV